MVTKLEAIQKAQDEEQRKAKQKPKAEERQPKPKPLKRKEGEMPQRGSSLYSESLELFAETLAASESAIRFSSTFKMDNQTRTDTAAILFAIRQLAMNPNLDMAGLQKMFWYANKISNDVAQKSNINIKEWCGDEIRKLMDLHKLKVAAQAAQPQKEAVKKTKSLFSGFSSMFGRKPKLEDKVEEQKAEKILPKKR